MPITPESSKHEPAEVLKAAAVAWLNGPRTHESDIGLELAIVDYGILEPIQEISFSPEPVGTDVHVLFESGILLMIPTE